MTGATPRVPVRVLDRIEEAGASAYAWYEDEFARYVDPTGGKRRLATSLSGLTVLGLCVCGAAANWSHGAVYGVVTLVIGLAASGVTSRFTALPGYAAATMALLAYAGSQGAALLVFLLLVVVTWWLLPRALRRVASHAYLVVVAVGLVGDASAARSWVATVVAAVGGGVAVWVGNGRSVPHIFGHRVTPGMLKRVPPAPPSRLPGFLTNRDPGKALLAAFDRPGRSSLSVEEQRIGRKRVGGSAERTTALMLLGLRRWRGTAIVHDVDLPGADEANLDHVVLTRAGVFVIDTKRFGTEDEPGLVTMKGSRLVHQRTGGDRSLQKSVQNISWGCDATSGLFGVAPTGVMVVHNADVEPGITVTTRAGNTVHIVCADKVLSLLEDSPAQFSRWGMSQQRWALTRLRSSTTGRRPRIVAPLGAKGVPRTPWSPTGFATGGAPAVSPGPIHPNEDSSPSPAEPAAVHAPQPTAPAQQAETAVEVRPHSDPAAQVQSVIGDRWEQMRVSEQAAPDDLEDDAMRTLWRGTPITVVEFVDDDMSWRDMVAMTGACRGITGQGLFVWACDPQQYSIYRETGAQVNVTTVPLSRVIVAEGSTDV